MLNKLLAALILVAFTASCQSFQKQEEEFDFDEPVTEEEFQQEGEFETLTEEETQEINEETEELIEEVEVSDRVFFAFDSSELSSDAVSVLDNQIAWLNSDPTISIIVEGHCDERGTREYNIALGERRAAAVKNYLVGNGVSASRIKTISYGKERPAFLGSTPEIWSKNRRAVTVIKQ
ncbi:MAG: peptidoglycan-associated lipoprotein Pal [Proteobacteria bacterium]|nr:peptidoglycan-associated lipoprotein Pal [Pseudomonadota bacterium]